MPERKPAPIAMKRVAHRCGLVVDVPETMFVKEIADGFVISPPGPKDLRIPPEVMLRVSDSPYPGDAAPALVRTVADRAVRYHIDHMPDGGYRFIAWFEQGARGIEVVQAERNPRPDTPTFELAWNVIQGAACQPVRSPRLADQAQYASRAIARAGESDENSR